MAQVNKYADRAAYEADKGRLSNKSAVSFIEENDELIYDGVNVVCPKSSAGVGDLVVYDSVEGEIEVIKARTVDKRQMPATLIPVGVVYAVDGDTVSIVSLDDIPSMRWAASYEVALTGFDLAAGGIATLLFGVNDKQIELPIVYAAGATLSDIAAQINADKTVQSYGWIAAADDAAGRIVLSANTWSPNYAGIDVASGCEVIRTPEDKNYQTTLTRVLIDGSIESVRRNNGVDSASAGCNPEKLLRYYSANGSGSTGIKPGSGIIIRESAFTEEANPELVAAYPTYRDYLLGEHMIEYPSAYGAILRDGRENTAKIGPLRFVDIRGEQAPCYPAAAAALDYGVTVEGATTGFEPGAWWLPSVEELYLLMHDRVLAAADVERDPVNRTLSRLGKTPCFASNYYPWTSCEYNSGSAFFHQGGGAGDITSTNKYRTYAVRPVSAL